MGLRAAPPRVHGGHLSPHHPWLSDGSLDPGVPTYPAWRWILTRQGCGGRLPPVRELPAEPPWTPFLVTDTPDMPPRPTGWVQKPAPDPSSREACWLPSPSSPAGLAGPMGSRRGPGRTLAGGWSEAAGCEAVPYSTRVVRPMRLGRR